MLERIWQIVLEDKPFVSLSDFAFYGFAYWLFSLGWSFLPVLGATIAFYIAYTIVRSFLKGFLSALTK